jgi:hypothetical protein
MMVGAYGIEVDQGSFERKGEIAKDALFYKMNLSQQSMKEEGMDSHPGRQGQELDLAEINKGERVQTHILRKKVKNLSQQGSTKEKWCRLTGWEEGGKNLNHHGSTRGEGCKLTF